ncbi:lysophospholipase [Paenibacillus sp. GD4]|uniref:alpha/beta hydrolase n=1 Tax=Paenibacillus sp. GD4 TaxID=3068890 RepID=UPI0027968083|nr:alpha/beta hydrolase [Paenibacillus sp. GD4]MDQ1911325.1 lysophospholipase [Paenibacillus sp. GD4]
MVAKQTFTWQDHEGRSIYVYSWLPEPGQPIRGMVQVAHGMVETAARYERFAQALVKAGYGVYANDHLGHGRTANSEEELGHLPKDAFRQMVSNVAGITSLIHDRHPGLPVFLLGHSMGSMLAKHYMVRYASKVRGVLLSGVKAEQGPELDIGIAIARGIMRLKGERHRSKLLDHLAFGPYNRRITSRRTKFDWLTRDSSEVDYYLQDPHCGGVPTARFFYELFKGLKESYRKDRLQQIPKDLPIFLFSGDDDPVGNYGKGVKKLAAMLRLMGFRDIEMKLYPRGRHEMLNEINRDEVTADVIDWLQRHS